MPGPLDEPDEDVNGDLDSTVGDDDEMADWLEWQTYDDDGLDDADPEYDDGEFEEDEEEEE